MDITKIPTSSIPDCVNAVIEVPYGSSIKYEINKTSGFVEVDRVMFSAVYYPANYGFVPNTLSEDGDPADILVLGEYSLHPGVFIKTRLIGILIMEDEHGLDEKLIAVPISSIDPQFNHIKTVTDLPEITLKRIKNFFETYKMLEAKKWVKVKDYAGVDVASEILQKAIDNFKS